MLEEHGIIRQYKSGDTVFKEGDKEKEMYVVRSGKVKIFRTRQGREVKLATLQPDDFFGEMALFGDHLRSASAQAVSDTELQVLDKDTFMSFVKQPVVWVVLAKMSERIREVDDKIEELSVQDQLRKEHLASLVSRKRWFT